MREHTILKILFKKKLPVKIKELVAEMGLSERTLREVIHSLNKTGDEHGFQVQLIRGQGYSLCIGNESAFAEYMREDEDKRIDLNNKEERQHCLLANLLRHDSFQSMEKLADQIGISRSTILSDLREVEEQLKPYKLSITRRSYYGIKIEGDEKDFRKAFSHMVLQRADAPQEKENFNTFCRQFDSEKLKLCLHQLCTENNLKISDSFLNNLLIHLFILLYRVCQRNMIIDGEIRKVAPIYVNIARGLGAWIAETYTIKLPDEEVDYLALHISGKTTAQNIGVEATWKLREDMGEILYTLDQEFLTCFNEDDELREALLMHLYPLLNRLYYNLQLENPLVENLYREYANVFVISFRFAEMFEEKYGFKISRDEVGYVALHFATHLERMKQYNLEQFKRIAVICSTGAGSANLIRLKIETIFPKASVITASFLELEEIGKMPIDLILSTIPLESKKIEKPFIHIKEWLDDAEVKRIQETISLNLNPVKPSYKITDFKELFQKDLFYLTGPDNYKQLLKQYSDEIVDKHYAEEDFTKQVLLREEKFTTIYKNGVAGPHPMRMGAIKDCISVTILRKPLSFEKKTVQIIFLINLRQGQLFLHKEISKMLLHIMENDESRKKLLAIQNFDQFMDELDHMI
ncbi:BglG family transcription antiterminator [Paenibacillus sp. 8b26]|uniref:BglG family transcription antiterminator n=1 Tax=Paenibacillus sp. 8b26 TaxID=3424133 RepID=UPI003D64E548